MLRPEIGVMTGDETSRATQGARFAVGLNTECGRVETIKFGNLENREKSGKTTYILLDYKVFFLTVVEECSQVVCRRFTKRFLQSHNIHKLLGFLESRIGENYCGSRRALGL